MKIAGREVEIDGQTLTEEKAGQTRKKGEKNEGGRGGKI